MKIGKSTIKSLAILIVLTILFPGLVLMAEYAENKYNLGLDLSFNSYASTSNESRALLANIDKDIIIYVLSSKNDKDMYLIELIKRYSALNSRIKHEDMNLAANPYFATKFKGSVDNPLAADSIIVYCEQTDRYKILSHKDFLKMDYNIEKGNFAFSNISYEKSLTEAIVFVSNDIIPKIQLAIGHGELNQESLSAFIDYVTKNNYAFDFIDLKAMELQEHSLLFIPSLKIDFNALEIEKIKAFEKNGGSILATVDFVDDLSNCPNYLSLLESYGIRPKDGVVMADEKDSSSYYKEPLYILPFMQKFQLLDPLIESNMDILLMPGAKAFEAIPSKDLNINILLKSGKTSYIANSNSIVSSSLNKKDIGEQNLSILSEKNNANGDVSKLLILGNSATIIDSYIYTISFATEFLQQSLNYLLPQKNIDLNIAIKPAFRQELLPKSSILGIGIIISTPILILLFCYIVIRHRKNL